jgi:hypothetical protein
MAAVTNHVHARKAVGVSRLLHRKPAGDLVESPGVGDLACLVAAAALPRDARARDGSRNRSSASAWAGSSRWGWSTA